MTGSLFSSLLISAVLSGDATERLVWGDFDHDGRLDAVALQPEGLRLLHNERDGTLADWTVRAGLVGLEGAVDAALVDVDADGWMDLFVVVPNGESRLLRQQRGVFQDASAGSGLELGAGIVRQRWIDWNADGLPDLSLRARGVERFYENLGAGSFRELVAVEGPATPVAGAEPGAAPGAEALAGSALTVGPAASGASRGRASASLFCAPGLADLATGGCLQASSAPMAGMLYPLGPEFMIDPLGFVGIGTTTPGMPLDVVGAMRADALTLTEIAGPPLIVSSSTVVTGLNVDLLDGLDSSVFSQLGASIEGDEILDGTITDDDIGLGASIAGTKIAPDFGGSDVETDGRVIVNGGAGATAQLSVRGTALDGLIAATSSTTGYGAGGFATAASGATKGVYGESASTSGAGVMGSASASTGDAAGVQGETNADLGTGVSGVAWSQTGTTKGVSGIASSTSGTGVQGFATRTTGATKGVYGLASSSSGTGVSGLVTSTSGTTTGLSGTSYSTAGTGVRGSTTATSGNTVGVLGETASSEGVGVKATATATSGPTVGVWAETLSDTSTGAFGIAWSPTGTTNGVAGTSHSTQGVGVRGFASQATGSTRGVLGQSNSVDGRGVHGFVTASTGTSFGVDGQSWSTAGTGVRGLASANTGSTYGVLGESASTTLGVGVLGRTTATTGFGTGVNGSTASSDGIGVAGSSTATSGLARGIVGSTQSPIGTAIQGLSLAGTGSGVGVNGEAAGVMGAGILGVHTSTGSLSNSFGVHGKVHAEGTGVFGEGNASLVSDGVRGTATHSGGYGVYGNGLNGADGVVGYASVAGTGDAIRALGDIVASGTKFFAQPHPTDASREIRFVCLEGNESGTYFRGSGQLVSGRAVIDVPESFRLVTLAEGLTVQLTAVGAPARLWIESRELEGIVVRGDLDVPFDYFVNGVRRGFEDFEPIQENQSFRPRVFDQAFGDFLPDELRADLVRTGLLHPDFTPNRSMMAALGWELVEYEEPVERAAWTEPERR